MIEKLYKHIEQIERNLAEIKKGSIKEVPFKELNSHFEAINFYISKLLKDFEVITYQDDNRQYLDFKRKIDVVFNRLNTLRIKIMEQKAVNTYFSSFLLYWDDLEVRKLTLSFPDSDSLATHVNPVDEARPRSRVSPVVLLDSFSHYRHLYLREREFKDTVFKTINYLYKIALEIHPLFKEGKILETGPLLDITNATLQKLTRNVPLIFINCAQQRWLSNAIGKYNHYRLIYNIRLAEVLLNDYLLALEKMDVFMLKNLEQKIPAHLHRIEMDYCHIVNIGAGETPYFRAFPAQLQSLKTIWEGQARKDDSVCEEIVCAFLRPSGFSRFFQEPRSQSSVAERKEPIFEF